MCLSSIALQLTELEINASRGRTNRTIGKGMEVDLEQRSGGALRRLLSDLASMDSWHASSIRLTKRLLY